MQVLIPGYRYQLSNRESNNTNVLQFVHTEKNELLFDGTTDEEVINVLIDRMRTMDSKVPCMDNKIYIALLEGALYRLEKRTNDRTARGVEGTDLP